MATQIDVVDINDNDTNEDKPVLDTPPEDVKPEETKPKVKAKAKAKSKAKAKVVNIEATIEPDTSVAEPKTKEELKQDIKEHLKKEEELTKIEEETEQVNETVKEQPQPVEEENPKSSKSRDTLKEKATCPDCGKELTVHGLKYTHKRYCKAKPTEEPTPPQLPLERTDTANAPPGLKHPVEQPTTNFNHDIIPTDEQIANYLRSLKVAKAQRKQQSFTALASKGLPQ